MYKAIILYFSGTGNTWWVSDRIKKNLDSRNINAEAISIESITNNGVVDTKKAGWLIKSSDLIFFGWPIYGSDLPKPMKNFIDSLEPLSTKKHIHTFCTQLFFSGDGAWLYHKNFADKHLIIDSCSHFIMPSNVSVFHGMLAPPKNEKMSERILKKCGLAVDKYIEDLLASKARITGRNSYILGIFQRGPYRAFYKKMQNLIGVDKSLCTKCGLCADVCSSNNIKMGEHPEFGGRCSLCLRCYSYCPAVAITYRGKTHNTKKHGLPYRLSDNRFSPYLLKPKKRS